MRRALVVSGLFITAAFFMAQTLEKPTLAATTSIWRNTFNIASDTVVDPADRNTADCSYANMRLRLYSAGGSTNESDLTFPASQEVSSTQQDLCTVKNRQGSFSPAIGYWSPTNNMDDVLQVENATIIPVPESNAVLFTTVFGSDPGGYRASINYNFSAIGELKAGYVGPSNQKVKFKKWRITDSAALLQYSNSSFMTFKTWAFSENGRYGIASLFSGMLIRIDLQTQEIQPISQLAVNKSDWRLGISNDGNYALSYHSTSSALTFHDLTACQTRYAKGMYPSAGASTAGCASTDLHTKIQSLYPSTVLALMSNFRFGSNGSNFSVDTYWRTSPAEITKRRIEFRAENYVPSNRGYIAMGDSFSSGEGDLQGGAWYEPGTDEQGNKDTFEGRNLCHLSRRSYPYLIAKELGYLTGTASDPITPTDTGLFHSVACSGAKIHNIISDNEYPLLLGGGNEDDFSESENQYRNDFLSSLGSWQPGRIKQMDFFAGERAVVYRAPQTPEIITIGIGGNDAGFGDIILSCVMPGTCKYANSASEDTASLAKKIASIKPKLVQTYQELVQHNPDARIYAHGYPNFVQTGGNCGLNVRLDAQELVMVNEGVKYMNMVVRAAALEAGVFYVDVENALVNRNLCSFASEDQKAFNGVTAGNDKTNAALNILTKGFCAIRNGCFGNESFHPNQMGHQLYRDTILSQTNRLQVLKPQPQKQPFPLPSEFFGTEARQSIGEWNSNSGYVSSASIGLPKALIAQGTTTDILLEQSNLQPGSTAEIVVFSDPISIGNYTVPVDGNLSVEFDLPDSLPAGAHEIHLKGVDKYGESVDYYDPIVVGQSSTDFDGDGVLNTVDSCPTVQNSNIDVDQDSIDDACDSKAIVKVVEPPPPPPVDTPKQILVQKLLSLVKKILRALIMLFR